MHLRNIGFTCGKVCTAASIAGYEMEYCAERKSQHTCARVAAGFHTMSVATCREDSGKRIPWIDKVRDMVEEAKKGRAIVIPARKANS